MTLKLPPFDQPMVDLATGRITLPWKDYFRFWKEINSKINALDSYTPGNLVRISSDGNLVDGGSEFAISKFSAYDDAGGISLGSSDTDLTWDTETWKDSDFYHTDGSAEIRCNFAGKVEITLYGTLYVATHVGTTIAQCRVRQWSARDMSWSDIGGLKAELTFSAASQRLNFTIMQTTSVLQDDRIKAVGIITSGSSTIDTIAGACGIKLERKQ